MRIQQSMCATAIAVVWTAIACTNDRPSITAPTTSVPAPPPAGSAPVTLSGRVTETPPTSNTGVEGAVVSIDNGLNAGKSAVTNPYGFYTIAGLEAGSFNVTVLADGYVGTSRGVSTIANAPSNFQLTPTPTMQTLTVQGDVGAGDGTCSDSVSQKPCRIVVIPIHNPGNIDALLTWTSDGAADLDVTLFQTGVATPLVRAASTGAGPEHLTASVTVGATYEFRITFAGGTARASYTIRISHPN